MKKVVALFCFMYIITISAIAGIDETIGKVVSLDGDMLHIVGEPLSGGGLHDVVVPINSVPVYDLITGAPVSMTEIKPGMCARIAYSGKSAVAVWLNYSHEKAAVLSVIVSDNIQYMYGYTVFLSACGKYRITLAPETVVYCHAQGALFHTDIVPGQEYFVWVDMITASSPSIVFPEKVVLVKDEPT